MSGVDKTKSFDHERTLVGQATPLPNQGGTLLGNTEEIDPTGRLQSSIPTKELTQSPVAATPPSSGVPIGTMIMGFLGILILIAGGLFVFTDLFQTPIAVPNIPSTFDRIQTDQYSIGMPRHLIPDDNAYIDQSSAQRTLHRWQSDNQDVTITLARVDPTQLSLEDYDRTFYQALTDRPSWQPIDEATAEDGTVRRSYRIQDDSERANGQIDIYYISRDEVLFIMEMYTADSVSSDSELIANLQAVLDSLYPASS